MKTGGRKWLGVAVCVLAGGWGTRAGCERVVGNRPIAFYGRVVDEQGRPLAGVSVRCAVIGRNRLVLPGYWGDGGEVFVDEHTRTTDDAGRFAATGLRGRTLKIEGVEKPGYKDPFWTAADTYPSPRVFEYNPYPHTGAAPHVPDPERPVTFPLERTGR